jgi:hypothetical protein
MKTSTIERSRRQRHGPKDAQSRRPVEPPLLSRNSAGHGQQPREEDHHVEAKALPERRTFALTSVQGWRLSHGTGSSSITATAELSSPDSLVEDEPTPRRRRWWG